MATPYTDLDLTIALATTPSPSSAPATFAGVFAGTPYVESPVEEDPVLQGFYEYWDAFKKGFISSQEFAYSFLQRNRENQNILQLALKTGRVEIVREIFACIIWAHGQGIIDYRTLMDLLQVDKTFQVNIVDLALSTGQPEIVRETFVWVCWAFTQGALTQKHLAALLYIFHAPQGDILTQDLASCRPELLCHTFNWVCHNYTHGIVNNKNTILTLFRALHAPGISILQKPLYASQSVAAQNTVAWIDWAYQNKILSPSPTPSSPAPLLSPPNNNLIIQQKAHHPSDRKERREKLESLEELFTALKSKQNPDVHVFKQSCAKYWTAFEKGQVTKETLASIFMETNRAAYTFLHRALATANPEIVNESISLIGRAFREGILNATQLAKLLCARNGGGFTILQDALKSNHLEIVQKTFTLVCEAFDKKIIDKWALVDLLCIPNNAGITLLNKALITNDVNIVSFVFNLLCKVYEEKILDKKSFSELLGARTHSGYTILNDVVKPGNLDIAQKTFDLILQAYEEGILDKETLLQLIRNRSAGGFNLLHDCLFYKVPNMVRAVFDFVRELHKKGIIDSKIFAELLLSSTKHEFSILLGCLIDAKNPEIMHEMYYLIREAFYIEKILDKKQLESLLCACNEAGNNIFFEALVSKDTEIVTETFEFMLEFYRQGIIDKKRMAELLCAHNLAGFTIVHEAILSKKPEIMRATFELIHEFYDNKLIDSADLTNLFYNINSRGYSILHQALMTEDLEIVKEIFDLVKEAFNEGAIHKQIIEKILLTPAHEQGSYYLFHTALSSNNLEIVRITFDWIRDTYRKGAIDLQSLKTFLCARNTLGFSLLHNAVFTKNPEILNETASLLRWAFQDDWDTNVELEKMLLSFNKKGFNLVQQALLSNNVQVVEITFDLLRKIPYSKLKNSKLLTEPKVINRYLSYSPLHHAVKTGNAEIVTNYLDFVTEVYEHAADKIIQREADRAIETLEEDSQHTSFNINPEISELLTSLKKGKKFRDIIEGMDPDKQKENKSLQESIAGIQFSLDSNSKENVPTEPERLLQKSPLEIQEEEPNKENTFKVKETTLVLDLKTIKGIDWDLKITYDVPDRPDPGLNRSWIARKFHAIIMQIIEPIKGTRASRQSIRENQGKILDYPESELRDNLKTIKQFLNQGYYSSLLALSVNHCSHFMDALHLPFECIYDRKIAARVALGLFSELSKQYWSAVSKNMITKREFEVILKARTIEGFNIVHQAILSADPMIVRETIHLIRLAYYNKVLDKKGLVELLLARNRAGFSIVMHAATTGQVDVVKEVFRWILDVYKTQIITMDELESLMCRLNAEGFSVVHEALMSSQVEIVEETFKLLKMMPRLKESNVLIVSNKVNYNPLHFAANTDNMQLFKMYLNFLTEVYKSEVSYLVPMMSNRRTKWQGKVPQAKKNEEINALLAQLRTGLFPQPDLKAAHDVVRHPSPSSKPSAQKKCPAEEGIVSLAGPDSDDQKKLSEKSNSNGNLHDLNRRLIVAQSEFQPTAGVVIVMQKQGKAITHLAAARPGLTSSPDARATTPGSKNVTPDQKVQVGPGTANTNLNRGKPKPKAASKPQVKQRWVAVAKS